MSAMKRAVLVLTLFSVLFAEVRPAAAIDWSYHPATPIGYPASGYPAPYYNNNHDMLKKVLIGGALVGIGYLAGRLTAPGPNYGYAPVPGPQPGVGYGTFYGAPQPGCRF